VPEQLARARRGVPAEPSLQNQTACKAGFCMARGVNRTRDGHSSATARFARRLKANLPGRRPGQGLRLAPRCRPYSVLLPVGFAVPLPLPEARCALYRTVSPLAAANTLRGRGGLFSVALSLGLPPAGRYPATVCPGARTFPPRPPFGIGAERAVQPTDPVANGARRPRPSRGGRLVLRLMVCYGVLGGCAAARLGPVALELFCSGPNSRATRSLRSVSRVEASVMPSTFVGRKCRWKAMTTSWVTVS